MDAAAKQEAIEAFCGFTAAPRDHAEHYLGATNYDVEAAVNMYLEEAHDDTADPDYEEGPDPSDDENDVRPANLGGGRRLGDDDSPAQTRPSASNQSTGRSSRRTRGGMMTLGDMQRSSGHAHGEGHDREDDESEQDLFAGGEKSGLAVQNPSNPRDVFNQIMQRARGNALRPGGDDERPSSHFAGRGVTLGGDDVDSQVIEDPHAARPQPPPRVHRTLRIWRNGFSVDDGPLHDANEPANQRVLQMIMNGHAPLNILDAAPGQEVDLKLDNRQDEDYVAPKKKFKAFSGAGQRLGSPTPGPSGPSTAPAPPAASSSTKSASSAAPAVNVDDSQPTISLQIRLADGTRLVSRFNTTHTIADIYDFVNRAAPMPQAYVLMTTFPSKELSDKALVLGDMAEFKRGGVVVQKRL